MRLREPSTCDDGAFTGGLLLYLSLYFKLHRDEYYEALQRVRTEGDWDGWMAYYLEGVDWTARRTIATTTALTDLFRSDRERIGPHARSSSTLRAFEVLQSRVVVSIRCVADSLKVSVPTATSALKPLEELGIAREITGKTYGRIFVYARQLEILNDSENVGA